LNLLNIGDEFINKVVDSGYVKDVVDFYKLDSYTILKILRPQLGKLEDKDFIKEIGNNKYSKDVLKADVIYNTILSIYKKPFSVILESFSLPGLGTASCKRLESIGILNITDYIEYLNNNLNTNNKRILETINNKIISNLKNIK
jgi:NAD-dependent DNA ligase